MRPKARKFWSQFLEVAVNVSVANLGNFHILGIENSNWVWKVTVLDYFIYSIENKTESIHSMTAR